MKQNDFIEPLAARQMCHSNASLPQNIPHKNKILFPILFACKKMDFHPETNSRETKERRWESGMPRSSYRTVMDTSWFSIEEFFGLNRKQERKRRSLKQRFERKTNFMRFSHRENIVYARVWTHFQRSMSCAQQQLLRIRKTQGCSATIIDTQGVKPFFYAWHKNISFQLTRQKNASFSLNFGSVKLRVPQKRTCVTMTQKSA